MENLKDASVDEIKERAEKIRKILVETVSKNGGHLGPNLGVVELNVCIKFLIFLKINYFLMYDISHIYIKY